MKDKAVIVTLHLEWIRRKAASLCPDPDKAKELAAETVFRCLKAISQYDTKRDFKPWALTVMINFYLVTKRHTFMPMPQKERASPVASDSLAHYNELLNAIERLPELHRIPIAMFARGYSYQEIATKLEIPIGTVKSRICNGRNLLKKRLLN